MIRHIVRPRVRLGLLPLLGASVAVVALSIPTLATAETLFEALASAYISNPTLQAARAAVRTTDEGVPQALSGWRPTVSVSGSAGVQSSETNASSTTTDQDLVPTTLSADISQSLYAGGQTVAGTSQAEANVQVARAQLAVVEQQVLLDGVTSFLDVLRDQATVQLTKNNETVLQRQLEATKDRFEVGEVTRTDVAQAEARLSGTVAERVNAEGALAISRGAYRQVFGAMPTTLQAAPPLPALPANVAEAIATAEAENPAILVNLQNEIAARHAVVVAKGNMLPTVDLAGRLRRTDEASIENSDTTSSSLIASVSIPLYQAGAVHSQIRQAKELLNQRRIEVEQSRRDVVQIASQSWDLMTTTRSQISARAEEIRANEIALEGVRQEAEVGSRTTLDVLDAEQELLNSRVTLVVAERDEYVAGYTLLAAIGRLTARHIGLPVEVYDPARHYQKVRNKWWGWNTVKD
ncbi:MAG: TolC family outer membrane protein [Rhodospirillaceae bacterium]|jgi:outer membrane protein|nr:TolC family outer membrane protein [Rhodospirillaceae bacterium]MBT4690182.1 TolC family outer membrane protein [Rhodospirillaceae bacterium]MBT5080747.1 TolC family outer membrane protein [Rhodospirillaceae bacterium]MBT5525169.1 TolC family outer membrane protein [Rhodospirillaceae bacterium]MBT5877738.1 TolC family outer membrane protein [Rhodospirillaceae bacterium]